MPVPADPSRKDSMTAPMTTLRRLAAILALAACAVLVVSTTASATTKLSWAKAKPILLAGGESTGSVYSSGSIVWLECPGKATAVVAGWSGPKAPIAIVYSHLVESNRMMGLAVRTPMSGGKFRGRTLCLSGRRVTTRESENGPVTCARRQIAIGAPIDGGPYWEEPLVAKPIGARGWLNSGQGKYARSKAICVPAKAFRKVQRIRRSATFPVGKATTTVKATCKRGRRPISWGFEAGPLPQNVWTSQLLAAKMAVPLISTSLPTGKAGWRLTFATPDGVGAKTATNLAIHLTCAVPA